MILGCPACNARFMVADTMIPAMGRTVRCGKCSHEWFVEGTAASVEAEVAPQPSPTADDAFLSQIEAAFATPEAVIKPLRVGANLPVIKRAPRNPKPFMFAVPAIAALWLVAAFIAYFPSWSKAPVLGGIYQALGVKPLDGLLFADVHMEREQEGSKTRFILTGSIRNHTSKTQAVPTVRVLLKDKNNKSVWGREYPVNTELKAGDVYPFRITNVETSFASSVASIVVDMGNSLQLLVR